MDIKKFETIEKAITLFSLTKRNRLTVLDHMGKRVGYFSFEDLQNAIQKGELTAAVEQYMEKNSLDCEEDDSPFTTNENEYSHLIESPIFSQLINSLHDGVYITDAEGETVFINKAYERITGLSSKELVGRKMDQLVQEGYLSQSASLEVLKQKKPITMMQKIKNGRNIIVSATPLYTDDDTIRYVISSVRDITELLKLKHELERQTYWVAKEENQLKDELITDLDLFVSSAQSETLFQMADKVAKTDVKVLIQGETGVGKSVIARYIHQKSKRANNVFLELNCGAIPANLIEAELFGYEPGAFTGASKYGKKGFLEQAHKGTLFFDEVGDLPLDLQVKLLKVVEEGRFMRIGSTHVQEVDVRFISATHHNLKELVKVGKFREDLYYRLNIIPLFVPPLRERKSEIVPMLNRFLDKFNTLYEENKTLSLECIERLSSYEWPGNIRELSNCMERLVVMTNGNDILWSDLDNVLADDSNGLKEETLKAATDRLERKMITEALEQHKTTRKAAAVLGISQATLVQKMKKRKAINK